MNSGFYTGKALLGIASVSLTYVNCSIIYWLMFSNKFIHRSIHHLFSTFPLVHRLCIGLSGINRGYSLVQYGIDGVTKSVGIGKMVARILCGTVIGCGTGFWFGKPSEYYEKLL